MNRPLTHLASLAGALLFALPALAAPGLRLSWDNCALDGRVANKAFACDTNLGSERLVLSFEPPVEKTDATGIEFTMHIKSSSGVMPAWWQVSPAGACRTGAIAFELSAGSAGNCEYPYSPTAAGGIGGFTADAIGPGSWRVLAVTAVPTPEVIAVSPGNEYYAMSLIVRHTKTVGTGACGGCTTPMCIGFGMMKLVDPQNASNLTLIAGGPNPGGSEEAVTWQGAYVRDYTFGLTGPGNPGTSFTCDPDNSSPARRSTWGAVKSLYH